MIYKVYTTSRTYLLMKNHIYITLDKDFILKIFICILAEFGILRKFIQEFSVKKKIKRK